MRSFSRRIRPLYETKIINQVGIYMSWTFYKILHLSSLFGAFLSLGGLWFFYAFISGRGRGGPASGKPGAKTSGGDSAKGATAAECGAFQRGRKVLLNFHGVFLFLAFTAGFGLTAKSGAVWSFWLYIKLIVWLLLAAAPYFLKKIVLQKKKSKAGAWALLAGLLALAILASAAASLKWGAAKNAGPDKPQAAVSQAGKPVLKTSPENP